jgi:flavodoxin I
VTTTQTGNTQTCAEKIAEALGPDASEPIDVDTLKNGQLAQAFSEHGALVVGTPTWNTGADTQRSGTGWDELYYDKLPELSNVLAGKKVAVFGLGDQVSYAENYADATGELYDVFSSLGCDMIDGSWSQEGYEHEASKSIRGDKFCGLLLDMVNQEELTDERIEQWVAQLKQNGILEGGGGGGGAAAAAAPVQVETAPPVTTASEETPVQVVAPPSLSAEERLAQLERENAELRELLAQSYQASSVGSSAVSTSSVGFTPHYNPVTNKTMWTSSDGRSSYVTVGAPPQMKLRP